MFYIMEFFYRFDYDVYIESDGEIIDFVVNLDVEFFYEVYVDMILIRVEFFVRGNIIYGIGVSDIKGGVVVIFFMMESLKKEGKDLNVGVVFVSDEEFGGRGLVFFMERYRLKMVVVFEFIDFEVYIVYVGNIEVYFEVDGKEVYGVCLESGVNVIEEIYKMFNELKNFEFFKQKGKYFDFYIGIQEFFCENLVYFILVLCKGCFEVRFLLDQEVEDVFDFMDLIFDEYMLKYEYMEIWDGYEFDLDEEIVSWLKL